MLSQRFKSKLIFVLVLGLGLLSQSTSVSAILVSDSAIQVSTINSPPPTTTTTADGGLPVTLNANANAATNGLTVDLGYAKYQGHVNPSTGNTEFLGVRFARAPVGPLRWEAPQSPSASTSGTTDGVIVANTLPKRCIGTSNPGRADFSPFVGSGGGEEANGKRRGAFEFGASDLSQVRRDGFQLISPREEQKTGVAAVMATVVAKKKRAVINPPGMSEDCLFLNVYVPGTLNATTAQRKLPVVVWIHGGGYSRGSASGISDIDFFDGNDLIKESPVGTPVIAVVIQYRLGLFGFLAGSEVGKEGMLNVGSLDQQAALRWVHEHIPKFGGDPGDVIVWGQSAGAGSSIQHMLGNGGNTEPKLLKSIISSSDFLPSQYLFDDPIPEVLFSSVAERAGCATVGDKLSCLRSASVDLLAQINDNMTLSGFFGTFTFTPVIDGKFIMKRISQLLREGNFNGVEVVFANSNSFEGIHFVNPAHPLPLNIYVKNLFPNIGDAEIRRAVEIYSSIRKDPGGNTTLTMTNQAVAVHGEAILICPTYWLLQAFNGKTYKSEFAIPPGDHIIDVPYYWPSQGDGPEYKNPEFDAAFSSSFLNFAVFQDPVGNGTPTWDRWSNGKNGMVEMLFNKTEDGQPVIRAVQTDEGLLERCRFWESVGHVTGQ